MKKHILSFILLGGIAIQGFAQSKVLLTKEAYTDMKAHGLLKSNVKYIMLDDTKKAGDGIKSTHITNEYIKQLKQNRSATSGCSCLVPLDNTFTVAEMTGGFSFASPPDYRNDDGYTPAKTLPFSFCFYGTNYNQVFINNNGNVTFNQGVAAYSAGGFPAGSVSNPDTVMVAPFWGDVDTSNPASGLVYYKITPTYMIVKWEAVGYFSSMADKTNTFQLIITNGSDPILPSGNNIAFCYGDMQWTTGSASGGVNGFGGSAATVGVNKGNGINYIQLGRFDHAGVNYDGGYGANDGVSWLDNQSFYFNACAGSNIAPIANGLNNCDTLRICGSGDTLILNGLFLAPEIGQNTTVTVNLNGTPNASVVSIANGNSATAQVEIIASALNAGNNIITFTATDNGTPVGITTTNVNVFVDTTGLSSFNPNISGNLSFCENSSSVLSVSPTNYDSYIWNTGSTNTSITVDTSGQYWVTSSKNGCYKTSIVNVVEKPVPTPLVVGPLFTCGTNPTILTIDSASLYTNYTWSNNSTNDSITVLNGTYSVTVTGANGCVATSPAVTVINANPTVAISGAQPFCPNTDILLTANPSLSSGANYVWSTTANTQSINVNMAGTYSVTVNYNNGCSASNSVSVSQFDSPLANFSSSPAGSSSPGTPVNFTDLSSVPSGTITSWVWNFGDDPANGAFTQNPSHTYLVDGTYPVTLAVQSSNGCWDTIRIDYSVISEIEVPNVFTPNNPGTQGLNNVFYIKSLDFFPGTSLKVYNRWGKKVYESKDYQNNWNGGNHPDGVYYYVLEGPLLKETKYGFVQILR